MYYTVDLWNRRKIRVMVVLFSLILFASCTRSAPRHEPDSLVENLSSLFPISVRAQKGGKRSLHKPLSDPFSQATVRDVKREKEIEELNQRREEIEKKIEEKTEHLKRVYGNKSSGQGSPEASRLKVNEKEMGQELVDTIDRKGMIKTILNELEQLYGELEAAKP